jgi:hypothetical protein
LQFIELSVPIESEDLKATPSTVDPTFASVRNSILNVLMRVQAQEKLKEEEDFQTEKQKLEELEMESKLIKTVNILVFQ